MSNPELEPVVVNPPGNEPADPPVDPPKQEDFDPAKFNDHGSEPAEPVGFPKDINDPTPDPTPDPLRSDEDPSSLFDWPDEDPLPIVDPTDPKEPVKTDDPIDPNDPGQSVSAGWVDLGKSLDMQVDQDTPESFYDAFQKKLSEVSKNGRELHPEVERLQDAIDNGANFEDLYSQTDKYSSIARMNDEEKVRWDMKREGFEEGDIDEFIEDYKLNNRLNLEAKKVDIKLRREKSQEVEDQKLQTQQLEQSQAREVAQMQNDLDEQLSKTESLLTWNLPEDKTKRDKILGELRQDIISGDFINFKDYAEVIEFAAFRRHKERLMKQAKQAGREQGKQEVLDNMTHVDLEDDRMRRTPMPNGAPADFDPKAFSSLPRKG